MKGIGSGSWAISLGVSLGLVCFTHDMSQTLLICFDLSYVHAFPVEGESANQVIAHIERVIRRGRWAVIVFHGIGAEWNVMDAPEFDRLIGYLANNRNRTWVAPFVEVASYVRSHRAPVYEK